MCDAEYIELCRRKTVNSRRNSEKYQIHTIRQQTRTKSRKSEKTCLQRQRGRFEITATSSHRLDLLGRSGPTTRSRTLKTAGGENAPGFSHFKHYPREKVRRFKQCPPFSMRGARRIL